MSTKCYNPIKGIDDVIASKIQGWNEYRVATLRGIYDENESIPLNVDNLDKAADTIMKYRVSLARKNMDKVKVFSPTSINKSVGLQNGLNINVSKISNEITS